MADDHYSDAEEHARQRYVDEHGFRRQVAIGAGVFVFLLLAVLVLRMLLG